MAGTAKAKLSISVESALIDRVDRSVKAKRYPSRSAAIEAALRVWGARERALQRDAAIEAYYLGASDSDRADDRAWAEQAYEGFVDIARAESGARARPPARSRRRAR